MFHIIIYMYNHWSVVNRTCQIPTRFQRFRPSSQGSHIAQGSMYITDQYIRPCCAAFHVEPMLAYQCKFKTTTVAIFKQDSQNTFFRVGFFAKCWSCRLAGYFSKLQKTTINKKKRDRYKVIKIRKIVVYWHWSKERQG